MSGARMEVGRVLTGDHPYSLNDRVEFQMLHGLGLPTGTTQVAAFDASDRDALIATLFVTAIFGCCIMQDAYVVPDGANYLLKTDHHGVVHIAFRDKHDVLPAVAHLEGRGFVLPTELPDQTFKPQPWLRSGSE